MTTLDEALIDIRDAVAALVYQDGQGGNIRATVDPAELNPPGVWVQIGDTEHSLARASSVVQVFHLWLVASTSVTVEAVRQIDRLRRSIVGQGALFWPDNPASWLPLTLPGDVKPLPALRLTIRTRVE